MTTPHTLHGKMFLMLYGLLGCAGGILFFNLFLERVINLLANTLRWLHTKHKWRKFSIYNMYQSYTSQKLMPRDDVKRGEGLYYSRMPMNEDDTNYNKHRRHISWGTRNDVRKKRDNAGREKLFKTMKNRENDNKTDNKSAIKTVVGKILKTKDEMEKEALEKWKPSVYWVLIILFLATCLIGGTVSLLYSAMENWSYTDSLYFCFISFATIGFGDFVSNQKMVMDPILWYKVVNFIILALGSCCTYSLLNVISIVIKQFLNLILKRFKALCWKHCKCCYTTASKEQKLMEQKLLEKEKAKKLKKEEHPHKHHKKRKSETRRFSRMNSIQNISNGIIQWKKRRSSFSNKKSVFVNDYFENNGNKNYVMVERNHENINPQNLFVFTSLRDHAADHNDSTTYSRPLERKMSERSEYFSRSPWRKDSGDMVSMQDFTSSNKEGFLEEMQRQLLETNKKIGFVNSLFPIMSVNNIEDESNRSQPDRPVIAQDNQMMVIENKGIDHSIKTNNENLSPGKTRRRQPKPFNIRDTVGFADKRDLYEIPIRNYPKNTNIIISTYTDADDELELIHPESKPKPRETLFSPKKMLYPRDSLHDEIKMSHENANKGLSTLPTSTNKLYNDRASCVNLENLDKKKIFTQLEPDLNSMRRVSALIDSCRSSRKITNLVSRDLENGIVRKSVTDLGRRISNINESQINKKKSTRQNTESESESDTDSTNDNSDKSDSNSDSSEHKLAGEEIGPLAILNKTLG
ncbi:unnamed protein product [Gordionus sp. m RMFG-2023]